MISLTSAYKELNIGNDIAVVHTLITEHESHEFLEFNNYGNYFAYRTRITRTEGRASQCHPDGLFVRFVSD